jgi:hypothetical protein
MGDDRGWAYYEDDVLVLRASSFGGCVGAHARYIAGLTPSPPSDFILNAYDAGIRHEGKIIGKLADEHGWQPVDGGRRLEFGPMSVDGQIRLEIACGPKIVVRCHPDTIAVKDGVERVVEVKLLGDSFYNTLVRDGKLDLSPKPMYEWQHAIECHATRLGGLYVIGRKNDEGVWNGEIEVFETEPRYSLFEIKQRAKMIAKTGGDIPECESRMWPCPFWPTHDTETGVWADQTVEVKNAELAQLAREVFGAKATSRYHTDEYEKLRDKLTGMLGDLDFIGATIRVGDWVVKTSTTTRAGKVNYNTMAADGIDVAKYRGPGSTGVRLDSVEQAE